MTREHLPDRRAADTFPIFFVQRGGRVQELILTVGRYGDGRIAETFIELPYNDESPDMELLCKDLAVLLSIALQNGAGIEDLRVAMGRSEVNWMGRMRAMPHSIIGAVLDALADLEKNEKVTA